MADKKKELTKRQKETMKRHRKHHTKAQMDFMTKKMMGGAAFTQAHKMALKKVGN